MRQSLFSLRSLTAVTLVLCTPTIGCMAAPEPPPQAAGVASDRAALPAERREFASPDKVFLLVIETTDHWKTAQPVASLLRLDNSGKATLRWSRKLPHHHGPRTAVVANDGHVLLADEWINVTSRWSLMLLDAGNQVVMSCDWDTATKALGVSVAEVSAQARYGTWMSANPSLATDGKSVRIPAGGRVMVVGLADGKLTSIP